MGTDICFRFKSRLCGAFSFFSGHSGLERLMKWLKCAQQNQPLRRPAEPSPPPRLEPFSACLRTSFQAALWRRDALGHNDHGTRPESRRKRTDVLESLRKIRFDVRGVGGSREI